jgi:chromosome segregation ATPase
MKRQTKTGEQQEKYLRYLWDLYRNMKDGKVTNLALYAHKHKIGVVTGTVLNAAGFITKDEGEWKWTSHVPDSVVAWEVMNLVKDYNDEKKSKPKFLTTGSIREMNEIKDANPAIMLQMSQSKIEPKVISEEEVEFIEPRVKDDVTNMLIKSLKDTEKNLLISKQLNDIANLESELVRHRSMFKAATQSRDTMIAQNNNLRIQLHEIERASKMKTHDIKQLESVIEELTKSSEQKDTEIFRLKEDVKNKHFDLDVRTAVNTKLTQDLDEAERMKINLEHHCHRMAHKESGLVKEVSQIRLELSNIKGKWWYKLATWFNNIFD